MPNDQDCFTVEEINDPTIYTAHIECWSAPRQNSPFIGDMRGVPGSYFVLLAGGGEVRPMWGAGRSTNDHILRAFGIQRALLRVPNSAHLRVFTRNLFDIIQLDGGHVRWPMDHHGQTKGGALMDAFELWDEITQAYDKKRWELSPVVKNAEPSGFSMAKIKASKLPKGTANVYGVLRTHTEPNCILATDEDPDPLGLLGFKLVS